MNKNNKKFIKFFYRLINPFFNPVALFFSLPRYVIFIKDFYKYSQIKGAERINLLNIYPRIHEKTQITHFDKHYFYQDTWAFKKIFDNKPEVHVDIGSRVEFVGFLSSFTKVKFVDIRPIETNLENLEMVRGNILSLPFENNSVKSLSCLSVAEHIGLGRYGDELDPNGTKKACKELARILSKNGNLYFALPVGKKRVYFNAHRIHSPQQIISYFEDLKLVEFSGLDDNDDFKRNIKPDFLENENFSCGLFHFSKI